MFRSILLPAVVSLAGGLLADDARSQAPAGPGVSQEAYLKASNTDTFDSFGQSVSVSGDLVVVGAPSESGASAGVNGDPTSNGLPGSGAAYVFARSGAGWMPQAYLKASNPGSSDRFGTVVGASGDTIVVSAYGESSSATGVNGDQGNDDAGISGAAYVFARDGASWSQQAYLKASNTEFFDEFGLALAIDGDTIVVGAVGEDGAGNGTSNAGAAYVFVRDGTTWSQQAYLAASNPGVNDTFGCAVAISGDTLVVGARGEDSAATGVNGNQSGNGAADSGAAYVFVRSGTSWTQQAYVKATNTGASDGFGHAVAVSGDTLVVGAFNEGSNATGVGGNQNNNSVLRAGAAYVYVRVGTLWIPQAYLKASNTGILDDFGISVAAAGDTVLVGADGESSRATGINGDQADNSEPAAGAAYLFVRSGATWSQHAYIKASNTDDHDAFGTFVSVSGDTIAIGAVHEASAATGVGGNQADDSAFSAGAAYVFDLGLDAWTDLGLGKAGASGVPLLAGSGPLTGGSANQLDLTGAAPSAATTLVAGLSAINAPFKGGTLVPAPLVLIAQATSAAGAAGLPFTWPTGIGPGFATYYQSWISDPGATLGFAASNGVQSITP